MLLKKIFITGCAGFIGSHLTEKLLSLGVEVIGIDNFDDFYSRELKEENLQQAVSHSRFSLIEDNISDTKSLNKLPKDIDVVVHLASKAGVRPSIKNPLGYIKANIVGTQNILSWMKENGISKLVFASSSSVYGNNKKIPFAESDNVDFPISPYAFTKKSCELLNHTFHHLYDIDIINLRFFTVYGPRQRPDLAIRKFVELIKTDKPLPIFGDGHTGRDYTFIDDIINGILQAIEYVENHQGVFETVNLGNHSPIKLIDLVSTLYNLLGKQKQLTFLPMQDGDVNLTFADISKAKKLFGYAPQHRLEEGLKQFIDWFEKTNG